FEIADAIGLTWTHTPRFFFGAHEELRARQQPPDRQLDAVLERAGGATSIEEAHQLPDVLRCRGTPVSAPRQRRKDGCCARFLVTERRRPAGQGFADAAGVGRTLGSEGSLNP